VESPATSYGPSSMTCKVWEAPGAACLRTSEADTATLYGLIRRMETLGLVLLKVDEVDVGESDHPPPS
jgi:hypothetical protein